MKPKEGERTKLYIIYLGIFIFFACFDQLLTYYFFTKEQSILSTKEQSIKMIDKLEVRGIYIEFEYNHNICRKQRRTCSGMQGMFIGMGDNGVCYSLNYPGNLLFQSKCHMRYQQILHNNCDIVQGDDATEYCHRLLETIQKTRVRQQKAIAIYHIDQEKFFDMRDEDSNESICFLADHLSCRDVILYPYKN